MKKDIKNGDIDERLKCELEALHKLNHPNVLKAIDTMQTDSEILICTQLCDSDL